MYSKLIVFFLAFFGILAAALPNNPTDTVTVTVTAPAPTQTTVSQCNTGNAVCCNNVGEANSSAITTLLGLLGVVLGPVTGLVGLGCTPISVIGVGSGVNCAQQPVCCTGVQFNGLVNVGCSPIVL